MSDQPHVSRFMFHDPPIIVLGDDSPGGAYVLRIGVQGDLWVRFGRFQGGRSIFVPAGEYLYVGSAMRGLASRLVRHARRTGGRSSQPIRGQMVRLFQAMGLVGVGWQPSQTKKLHWHVDYLLDETAVDLTQVFLIRSSGRLESELARRLAAEAETAVLALGLGASDVLGGTHLLRVNASDDWWRNLPVVKRETC